MERDNTRVHTRTTCIDIGVGWGAAVPIGCLNHLHPLGQLLPFHVLNPHGAHVPHQDLVAFLTEHSLDQMRPPLHEGRPPRLRLEARRPQSSPRCSHREVHSRVRLLWGKKIREDGHSRFFFVFEGQGCVLIGALVSPAHRRNYYTAHAQLRKLRRQSGPVVNNLQAPLLFIGIQDSSIAEFTKKGVGGFVACILLSLTNPRVSARSKGK